jgi:hypothetical protein
MAATAEAADMLRVGRSGVYRYRSHAVGADQDRPLAARIGRLDPPCRSPECDGGGRCREDPAIRRVGDTGARRRRRAMCSRHDPLLTTADVAAFLMYGPTAARKLLQIATRR